MTLHAIVNADVLANGVLAGPVLVRQHRVNHHHWLRALTVLRTEGTSHHRRDFQSGEIIRRNDLDVGVRSRVIRSGGSALNEEARRAAIVIEGHGVGDRHAADTGNAAQAVFERGVESCDLGITGIRRSLRLLGGDVLVGRRIGHRHRAVDRLWQGEARRQQAAGHETGIDLL
jgi:hypothetical protein